MIDYNKELVAALNTILPTHYEMALHSGLAIPCLSYMEINNYVDRNGDTLGYGRLTYQVKIWANDIATIQEYALRVDEVLRPLGFTRVASGELYDNNSSMIQKIMTFEALYLEQFN